ncbi:MULTISPECIES: hypothetical protein [Bacillus cereus group]|uniref:hypothetical protein n=1 Tax=Bacillus cereus group TaxID=86661 RepID=UPI000279EA98|nr:hypothetical protein [Bacillus cereus]EJR29726.1 hypothetical protein IIE_04966 [Bacillus cereus VD045]HDR4347800.1 hypothetical protein [Bacillus cereus]
MKSHLQQLIKFYGDNMSNSNILKKQGPYAWICIILTLLFFMAMFFNQNTTQSTTVIISLLLITLISYIVLVYKLEKKLGGLENLTTAQKIGVCCDTILTTKFLIYLNDTKSLREEKINRLRNYFEEKGFYNEKHLKIFMDVSEKECQNRFSNISWLSLLVGFLIPIWTYFMQNIFKLPNIKLDTTNLIDINMVKFIFIGIACIVSLYYIFIRFFWAAIKSIILLLFPVRKYEMLDLTSLIRELYLECYIEENQEEKSLIVKGFVRKE